MDTLKSHRHVDAILATLQRRLGGDLGASQALQVMEVMLQDGWIAGKVDAMRPKLSLDTPREGAFIHTNFDLAAGSERPAN